MEKLGLFGARWDMRGFIVPGLVTRGLIRGTAYLGHTVWSNTLARLLAKLKLPGRIVTL